MEATAVGILRRELEKAGGQLPITSLAVRCKWGQSEPRRPPLP